MTVIAKTLQTAKQHLTLNTISSFGFINSWQIEVKNGVFLDLLGPLLSPQKIEIPALRYRLSHTFERLSRVSGVKECLHSHIL